MRLKRGSRPVPNCPDDYVLVRKIGAGAFGEVWQAHGPGGLDVALKFIRLDSHVFALELRSLEVMKSIRHPNLVSVFGAWHRDNQLILAMELCDGSLQDRLDQALAQKLPGIPLSGLLTYMRDAAAGLDALNASQVQHRDVKPANLLLLDSGVKVADFGLAKALERTVASNSGAGTVAYIAPECFKGQLTQQSDQYSLAVTYYHLRTGRLLFKGDQAQIMYAHLELEPDLSQLPPAEGVVLARALSKDPAKRWRSCTRFVHGLIRAYRETKETLRKRRALFYYNRGDACVSKGECEQAIKDFDEAIRLDPTDARAHCARGWAWWSKKEYDRAIKDFDDAIRLEPNYARAYAGRASARCDKNEYERAMKDFDEAIRLDPKDHRVFFDRGVLQAAAGKYDEAMKDFDELIRLKPCAFFYNYHAALCCKKGNYREAVRDLEKAIQLDPEDAYTYNNIAWDLATCPEQNVRDGNRAIQMARKACQLTGWNNARELSTLAAAYAEAGQFDRAELYQGKALDDPRCQDSERDQYRQRLELYKQKRPFRQS